MHTIDGARCFQAMVPRRDGVRLNTFVFLPQDGGPRFPVILHRTPYGITLPGQNVSDCTKGWLPDPQTPLLIGR
jgi:predicted acyl esterase